MVESGLTPEDEARIVAEDGKHPKDMSREEFVEALKRAEVSTDETPQHGRIGRRSNLTTGSAIAFFDSPARNEPGE